MCMLIYSPNGKAISGNLARHINAGNSNGIGIMFDGQHQKFYGRHQVRDALKCMREVAARGLAFGMHFRFATAGRVDITNVHPFPVTGTDLILMHNGTLGDANALGESDTCQFAKDELAHSPGLHNVEYWNDVGSAISSWNKLLVMDSAGQFRIVNEYLGDWIDGIWFSQTYSLPRSMRPRLPVRAYTSKVVCADSEYEYFHGATETNWKWDNAKQKYVLGDERALIAAPRKPWWAETYGLEWDSEQEEWVDEQGHVYTAEDFGEDDTPAAATSVQDELALLTDGRYPRNDRWNGGGE